MEDERKHGPAKAFPVPDRARDTGMSLRDWFAGQALTGMIIANSHSGYLGLTLNAYKIADAMLEARDAEG